MKYCWQISVVVLMISIYTTYRINRIIFDLCETEKCPNCVGINLCQEINEQKLVLKYQSFRDIFYNLFSVKNVLFAKYRNTDVVLKKLSLNRRDAEISNSADLLAFLYSNQSEVDYKFCDIDTIDLFLEEIYRNNHNHCVNELSFIFQTSIEPLLLELAGTREHWPFPKLYGYCGKAIVEEYSGDSLNDYESSDWHTRAHLALKLMEAAVNLTENDDLFNLYLTDISPDNIAIDENLNVKFIDLDNIVIKKKDLKRPPSVHQSQFFDEDNFVYSEEEICRSTKSDHNIYSVCYLLLSRKAPWPMMQNGLLHSPPTEIVPELFEMIENCADPPPNTNRFSISHNIIVMLKQILADI